MALGRDLRSVAALQRRLVETQQAMEREYAGLRNAETRYRLLFQVSAEAVVVLEADSGRIIEVNPAATRLLGHTARSLEGRSLSGLFDGGSRKYIEGLLAQVTGTGQGTLRKRADDFFSRFGEFVAPDKVEGMPLPTAASAPAMPTAECAWAIIEIVLAVSIVVADLVMLCLLQDWRREPRRTRVAVEQRRQCRWLSWRPADRRAERG